MVGLKRRKRVEGWAAEVPEADGEGAVDLRQRIADNNKLWIGALAGVLLLTMLFMKTGSKAFHQPKLLGKPASAHKTFRGRQAEYDQLARSFTTDKRYKDAVVDARFLTPGQLMLVVGSATSADDVDYISKMAAEKVRSMFKHRSIVEVYMQDAKGDNRSLIATTQWEPRKYGFVVKYHNGATRPL